MRMAFSIAWLLFSVLIQGVVLMAKKPCTEDFRTKVSFGTMRPDGGLQDDAEDTFYQKGTFWKEGGHWWACPCLAGHCVRLCEKSKNAVKLPFKL